MKVGIGKNNDDKDVNLSTRGLINALTVEIVDSSGNQVTSFVAPGLVTAAFDYIAVTYPTTSSEVYTYKSGGSGGTTVATITVVYTTSAKDILSSVTKT